MLLAENTKPGRARGPVRLVVENILLRTMATVIALDMREA